MARRNTEIRSVFRTNFDKIARVLPTVRVSNVSAYTCLSENQISCLVLLNVKLIPIYSSLWRKTKVDVVSHRPAVLLTRDVDARCNTFLRCVQVHEPRLRYGLEHARANEDASSRALRDLEHVALLPAPVRAASLLSEYHRLSIDGRADGRDDVKFGAAVQFTDERLHPIRGRLDVDVEHRDVLRFMADGPLGNLGAGLFAGQVLGGREGVAAVHRPGDGGEGDGPLRRSVAAAPCEREAEQHLEFVVAGRDGHQRASLTSFIH